MMMVRHCGFLVVQSYESRLVVPGSRRSLLSTKGSSPSHGGGGNGGDDDVETDKCTEQQLNQSAFYWHFCN